ncbi:MAG: hypothetical protein K1X61_13430 [Chitinophagales bacterium]|nr:hypothetical protein [Chitinophagales bacterium]
MKTKIIVVIAFALAGLQSASAQHATIQPDGKKYKVELIRQGSDEAAIVQTLIFDNGMLQTPGFNSLGFKEATAYLKQTEDYFTWVSTVNSAGEGAMGWQGTIKGDKIEGTCVWRKQGAQPVQYNFKGTEITAGGK